VSTFAAAKRELFSASEHKSQICASRLGARAANPGMSIGGVHSGSTGGRPSGGVLKDTGAEVTIHVRVPYCVVRPKGTTIRGLHVVYFSPVTTSCPKSLQQGVALTGRKTTGPLCAAPW